MAKIVIIKLFYGMTITGAQLAGQIKAGGHEPKIIYFKRQEVLKEEESHSDEYQLGDVPMQSYTVSKSGSKLVETSVWKKTKPNELKYLVKMIEEFKADVVGISTLSLGLSLAEEVTEHLRKHIDLPILWGGTGPTVEPERAIKFADLVCVGEGENVILDIGERLDKKEPLDGIPGTWFRLSNGEIQRSAKRPVSNLDEIAVPDWEPESYAFINGPRFDRNMRPDEHLFDKSYQIMTQRGCPFSCSFCVESFYQNEFGKQDSLRRMAPEKAIAELRIAKEKYGHKTVTFMDDVFTVNPRWLKEFLPLYKKEIDLPFFCYTYPTTHNANVLKMLEQAGCHAITMGVQSGSQRILTEVFNRPTKLGRVVDAAKEIVESGIPAATFDVIPQTDFDTEEDLQETLNILLQIPKEIDTTFYNKMAYFPNYPMQEAFQDPQIMAKAENLSEDVYLYYFKLYDMTRTAMPVDEIRAIAEDPLYRKDHNLLNPFLNESGALKSNYGELIEEGIVKRQKDRSNDKQRQ